MTARNSRPPRPDISAAEAGVCGSLLTAGSNPLPPTLAKLVAHAPEAFDDPKHGLVAEAVRALMANGQTVDTMTVHGELTRTGTLESVGGVASLMTIANVGLPLAMAEIESEPLWRAYQIQQASKFLREANFELDLHPDKAPSILALAARGLADLAGEGDTPAPSLTARLCARRFDATKPPVESAPVFHVGSVPVSTAGNLTTVSAPVKSGKSAVVGALLAASMTPATRDTDCLGFSGFNADGKAVVHMDTEQSLADHHALVSRALRRAGAVEAPVWLHSYCVTGFPIGEARRCLRAALEIGREQCGGIHSVLVDGVADMVCDVNDAAESNDFTAELHALAIEFNAPVVGVIHLNPGTEKTRGHLGSQLERKAETNLRLEKDGESIVVWSDKNRRAPILKKDGPRFAWSDQAGMHVSVASGQASADSAAETALRELSADLFTARPSMNYTDLVTTAKTSLAVSERTAARKIAELSRRGFIEKSACGLWKQRV